MYVPNVNSFNRNCIFVGPNGLNLAPAVQCLNWNDAIYLRDYLVNKLNIENDPQSQVTNIVVVLGPAMGQYLTGINYVTQNAVVAWFVLTYSDGNVKYFNAGRIAEKFIHGTPETQVMADVKNEFGIN